MADETVERTMTLTAEDIRQLASTIADLYFAARAGGPVPMQKDYWPGPLTDAKAWLRRLEPTEEELWQQADAAYERATEAFSGEPS